MVSTSKKRWVDYLIFGLSVFLVFCLVFEQFVQLPPMVSWLGRWHTLVLHFPIVLLLIAVFMGLGGKQIPRKLLIIAVLSALATAIFGFFLGMETPVKGDLLFWHERLGAGLALVSAFWYWLESMGLGQKVYSKGLQVVLIGLVGFTGHYGGMVTHGEDFLALPSDRTQEKIPDNPLIYKDVVGRILANNCTSCHNPNKRKGELLMTNLETLLKGGKSGHTVVPGDPIKSEIIRRLHLPMEDEEHMPPEGKKPLNEDEVRILERWIALGASDTLRLDHLDLNEPMVGLVKGMMDPNPSEKWAALPIVADSTLQHLSSDYLTIERVASNLNALSIDVFLPPKYDAKPIMALKRIAQNIVELDLSGLPIGAEEMGLVKASKNLEWLELDRTPVGDSEMDSLQSLSHLKLLKIYGTQIGDKSIDIFKSLENLKSLYIWETDVTLAVLEALKTEKPNLMIDNGINEDTKAFFVASDSVPKIK